MTDTLQPGAIRRLRDGSYVRIVSRSPHGALVIRSLSDRELTAIRRALTWAELERDELAELMSQGAPGFDAWRNRRAKPTGPRPSGVTALSTGQGAIPGEVVA